MKELICSFKIRELLNYEQENQIAILEELHNGNIDVVFDLIKMGLKFPSDEDTEKYIESYIEQKGIENLFMNLAYSVIGRLPNENDKGQEGKSFQSFTEFIDDSFSDIQAIDKNLSLMNFWDLTSKQMYTYADGLKKRYISNKNMELQSQYNNVAMLMAALAGKLDECPQLNEDGELKQNPLEEKLKKLGMLFD